MKNQRIEKRGMWELAAWIVFILAALFLLNPAVRAIPSSLIFYTMQGAMFGLFFFASTLLEKKLSPNFSKDHSMLIFIFMGFVCGALSSMPSVGISWLGYCETLKLHEALVPCGIEEKVKAGLIIYGICSSILGAFLGFWVAYRKERNYNKLLCTT